MIPSFSDSHLRKFTGDLVGLIPKTSIYFSMNAVVFSDLVRNFVDFGYGEVGLLRFITPEAHFHGLIDML